MVMRVVVLCLLVIIPLGGCVAQDAREALEATTVAERRIGSSGSQALSSIAALNSRLGDSVSFTSSSLTVVVGHLDDLVVTSRESVAHVGSTIEATTGLMTELRGIAATLRGALDDGSFSKRMDYAILAGLGLVMVHVWISTRRTHKKIDALTVKGAHRG